jgi:hypothetical protein
MLSLRCLMKPFGLSIITLAVTAFIGCGGGGGDDQDSIPEICRTYCSFACSKAVGCGIFAASEQSSCDDSCVRTIASNGGTAASCDRGGEQIAAASCSQLRTILGMRSLSKIGEPNLTSRGDDPAAAQHCGAEFASSATE